MLAWMRQFLGHPGRVRRHSAAPPALLVPTSSCRRLSDGFGMSDMPMISARIQRTRHEAEEIKHRIGRFLRDILRLELSETKTLITHARDDAARFLGYEVVALHADGKHDQRGQRIIHCLVRLKVPMMRS